MAGALLRSCNGSLRPDSVGCTFRSSLSPYSAKLGGLGSRGRGRGNQSIVFQDRVLLRYNWPGALEFRCSYMDLRNSIRCSMSTHWSQQLWHHINSQVHRHRGAFPREQLCCCLLNASLSKANVIASALRISVAPMMQPVVVVPVAIAIIVIAGWGFSPSLEFFETDVFKKNETKLEEGILRYIMASYVRPLMLWGAILIICRTLDPIQLSSAASQAIKSRFIYFVQSMSTVLVFAVCTASFIKLVQRHMMQQQRVAGIAGTRNLSFQFLGNCVSGAVWLAAVCLFVELLGFSTQKWITAGGFSTVLLTLAGRELVTNFLSSIMVHAARPFIVNEWITATIDGQEVSGTVEHVGWWDPTVIRGDDREAVYIPNQKFSVTVVRNLSQKTHWRIKQQFGISHLDYYKVGDIVAMMRKVVAKHPQVEQKHLHRRVFVDSINPETQGVVILVSCFVKTPHFQEYLRVKEMVILDLLKVISYHGARIATPIRSVQRLHDDHSSYRDMASTSDQQQGRPYLLQEGIVAEGETDSTSPLVEAVIAETMASRAMRGATDVVATPAQDVPASLETAPKSVTNGIPMEPSPTITAEEETAQLDDLRLTENPEKLGASHPVPSSPLQDERRDGDDEAEATPAETAEVLSRPKKGVPEGAPSVELSMAEGSVPEDCLQGLPHVYRETDFWGAGESLTPGVQNASAFEAGVDANGAGVGEESSIADADGDLATEPPKHSLPLDVDLVSSHRLSRDRELVALSGQTHTESVQGGREVERLSM